MKKTIFLLVIFLFCFKVFGATNEYSPQKRDPFIAGLLSWSMLGLGQFYNKEYTKGSLFVLGDLAQKGLLIWLISDFNKRYYADKQQIVKWSTLKDRDKFTIIGYLTLYVGLKIWSVADAVHSSRVYNDKIDEMVKIKTSWNSCDISITRRF